MKVKVEVKDKWKKRNRRKKMKRRWKRRGEETDRSTTDQTDIRDILGGSGIQAAFHPHPQWSHTTLTTPSPAHTHPRMKE